MTNNNFKIKLKKNAFIFAQYFSILTLTCYYLYLLKPFTNVLIYQGRDILRASDLAFNGNWFWYGPELLGGGYLPGGLYYALLAIPIWLTNNLYSTITLQHLFVICTGIFSIYSIKKTSDFTTALWFYLLFLTIPYTLEFFLQFDNPSFLYPFLALIFHLFYKNSLTKIEILALGALLSFASQLHGSINFLFFCILVILLTVRKIPLKSLIIYVLGYYFPAIPYFVWKIIYSTDEWGSVGTSLSTIYNESLLQYNDWLNNKVFWTTFYNNLLENLSDHFFWSISSQILITMLALGSLIHFLDKKRLALSSRVRVSFALSFILLVPGYFYLIAYPLERPRYVLVSVFSFLYFFSFLFHDLKKNKLISRSMLFVGVVLSLIWLSSNDFEYFKNYPAWLVGFLILTIYLFKNEVSKNKGGLLPLVLLFIISYDVIFNLQRTMDSGESNPVNISNNQIQVQCRKKVRTIQERDINDLREFLTYGAMNRLSLNILNTHKWSPEYFNEHSSYYGINQSNEFFSVYKNNYDLNLGLPTHNDEGLLFVFNSNYLCLNSRDKKQLFYNPSDFINSFQDMDQIIKKELLSAPKEIHSSGSFVLIWTKKFESLSSINNMGFPYRYPSSLSLMSQFSPNEMDLSGFKKLSQNRGLFYVNHCKELKNYCLSGVFVEKINNDLKFEILSQSMAQPTVYAMPGFTQSWLNPKLIIYCKNQHTHQQLLAENLGNTEFENYLLTPLRGTIKSPCLKSEIQSARLNIKLSVINSFNSKSETANIDLFSGDIF